MLRKECIFFAQIDQVHMKQASRQSQVSKRKYSAVDEGGRDRMLLQRNAPGTKLECIRRGIIHESRQAPYSVAGWPQTSLCH